MKAIRYVIHDLSLIIGCPMVRNAVAISMVLWFLIGYFAWRLVR